MACLTFHHQAPSPNAVHFCAIASQNTLVKLRDLVTTDTVALKKWGQIVDHIVKSPADVLTIERKWKDMEFAGAVLYSLETWNSAGGQPEDLIKILNHYGLNILASQILKLGLKRNICMHSNVEDIDKIIDTNATFPSSESNSMVSDSRTTCITRPKRRSDGAVPIPIPLWFAVGQVVHNFTGRETELETLHRMLIAAHDTEMGTAHAVCIFGLGGIGKTSLATKYAWDKVYRHYYNDNVVWVNAETMNSIRDSFVRLSEYLGLSITSRQAPNAQLAQAVFERLRHTKCLFIFDNVEEKSHIKQWQPTVQNPNEKVPHILITSRRSDLTPLPENQLKLGNLQANESVQLILRILPNSSFKCAEQLAERLQNFPLALQQAVAYIRDQYIDDEEAILKYLKEFDESMKELLNDERFKVDINYSKTTLTVWRITLTRIKEMKDGGAALKLINALAYIKPDSISVKFVKKVLEAELALRLLEKFSMVQVSDAKVIIHRLVQDVTRLNQTTLEQAMTILQLTAAMRYLDRSVLGDLTRECASHGMYLFQFQVNNHTSIEYQWKYLSDLCNCLIEYGNYAECISISEQAASYYEAQHGGMHESTLRLKWRSADAQHHMGQYTDSMIILRSILAATEIYHGKSHALTMDIRSTIASVLSGIGQHAKAIEIYDDIILTRLNLHGEDEHVLVYKYGKAVALRKLGRADEALELHWFILENRIESRRLGAKDLSVLKSKHEITLCCYQSNKFIKALELWEEQVEEGYKAILGANHPDTLAVSTQKQLARLQLPQEQPKKENVSIVS